MCECVSVCVCVCQCVSVCVCVCLSCKRTNRTFVLSSYYCRLYITSSFTSVFPAVHPATPHTRMVADVYFTLSLHWSLLETHFISFELIRYIQLITQNLFCKLAVERVPFWWSKLKVRRWRPFRCTTCWWPSCTNNRCIGLSVCAHENVHQQSCVCLLAQPCFISCVRSASSWRDICVGGECMKEKNLQFILNVWMCECVNVWMCEWLLPCFIEDGMFQVMAPFPCTVFTVQKPQADVLIQARICFYS